MIEFRGVSKKYFTGTHALKDVSFKIMNGEFVFVIGKSGAGKSTLIKLLTCEEKPSEGSVLIDDFDISRIRRSLVPYLRRNIGMVFQDFRLIETKTVFENVAFAMEIIGASRRSIRRRVPIVLSIVGLRDKASARPGELSGGEQQRVAIARAMVNNPMLILADEPTGNLDPANSESIMALLEEISRSGTTIIVCTHDRDLVDRMKKRVVEIEDGFLVRDDCQGAYASCNPVCPTYRGDAEENHITDSLSESGPEPDCSTAPEAIDLPEPHAPADDVAGRTGDRRPVAAHSRSERLARALERQRLSGHDIYLPSAEPADNESDLNSSSVEFAGMAISENAKGSQAAEASKIKNGEAV